MVNNQQVKIPCRVLERRKDYPLYDPHPHEGFLDVGDITWFTIQDAARLVQLGRVELRGEFGDTWKERAAIVLERDRELWAALAMAHAERV